MQGIFRQSLGDGDDTLSDSEYMSHLTNRGKEELAENAITKSFEGEIETYHMFRYGKDFFKGDIVQLMNEYGIESRVRVTEMVWSQNTEGTENLSNICKYL